MKSSRRRTFRRALGTVAALGALLAGGLTYATRVSGLEVTTPNGVHVIVVPPPIGDNMPARQSALYSQVESLAEEHPTDLSNPGYDWLHHRLYLGVATERGRRLLAGLDGTDAADVTVRQGALSVSDFDRITTVAFERVGAIDETSYDGVHDRVVLTTRRLGGVLPRVEELFGPRDVAVSYAPFAGPDRAM